MCWAAGKRWPVGYSCSLNKTQSDKLLTACGLLFNQLVSRNSSIIIVMISDKHVYKQFCKQNILELKQIIILINALPFWHFLLQQHVFFLELFENDTKENAWYVICIIV